MNRTYTSCTINRLLLVLIFILSGLSLHAEDKEKPIYTDAQLQDIFSQSEKLKGTTLLVILDDPKSSSAKKYLAAIEKNWTFTPYRIAKGDSINKFISNPRYSILTVYYENSDEKKGIVQGYYLGIFIGDEKNKDFDNAEEFTSIAIPGKKTKSTAKIDSILKENTYLFNFFIGHLQNDVIKANNKSNITVHSSSKNLCTYYDNGKDLLTNKTILIVQDGIDEKFDPKAFIKNFNLKPEQLKIVEKKEIETAILKQNDKIAFGYDFVGGKGKLFDANKGTLLAEGYAKGTLKTKILFYSIAPAFVILLVAILATAGK